MLSDSGTNTLSTRQACKRPTEAQTPHCARKYKPHIPQIPGGGTNTLSRTLMYSPYRVTSDGGTNTLSSTLMYTKYL
ncbi:hypothetical protein Taro_000327 [Colocasia esculenta]|uniref:Uncharacterized protein n=1 Tax=Colocasia esculenta TaxID=4460 RepID=A0A843TG55_COLES|nr:hypothetical protein [Colocasia esculenta]